MVIKSYVFSWPLNQGYWFLLSSGIQDTLVHTVIQKVELLGMNQPFTMELVECSVRDMRPEVGIWWVGPAAVSPSCCSISLPFRVRLSR